MAISFECLRDLKKIGGGSFGIVYLAEHEDWGTVAYKELPTSYSRPESRSVFTSAVE